MADAVSQVGDRIENLLAEIRAMVPPPTMERIDELVRCIVSLYGSGLERMMQILDENEADIRRLAWRRAAPKPPPEAFGSREI